MSPTVFRCKGYRFFFFSREEKRMRVHIHCADGEAKFWLDPEVALARNYGLSPRQLAEVAGIIKERQDDVTEAWRTHFRS